MLPYQGMGGYNGAKMEIIEQFQNCKKINCVAKP
jgi:hypothetical protein